MGEKEAGADCRVHTITQAGLNVLKEGLEMVKGRRPLMDNLVQFCDSHFIGENAGIVGRIGKDISLE